MPGTIAPQSGLQGFWAVIQGLTQRLAALEAQQRMTLAVRAGIVPITFAGPSQLGTGTITHGLGRVPLAVLLGWEFAPGSVIALGSDTYTASTALAHGWCASSLAGTFNAAWIVAG